MSSKRHPEEFNYRPMQQEGLRAQVGHSRRSYRYGKPAVAAINQQELKFDVEPPPNQARVTDITHIRTHED